MIKQVYFEQFSLTFVNKVKWLQALLCITDNSIKRQWFVYTKLNDQTVLFQTIEDMPALDNITSLQSFLGLANYYQVLIQNTHNLRALINEL